MHQAEKRKKEWEKDILTVQPENWLPIIKKNYYSPLRADEGRVLAAETIGTVTPMLVNITNAEFVTSLGADIIMLNILTWIIL